MTSNDLVFMSDKERERFWSKVSVLGDDDCWIWCGAKNKNGYGRFILRGADLRAHRIAFTNEVQEFSGELCVLHKCDNPSCINPSHLFLGTQADNNADMESKGRSRKAHGESVHKARLSEIDIPLIREWSVLGYTKMEISKAYGVSWGAIDAVVTRRSWKHVEDALL